MSFFSERNLQPMLIGASSEPFDSPEHIFELKLDGERCLVYLDAQGPELKNKRNHRLTLKFPELATLHQQVSKPCLLDGELIVSIDGKPSFAEAARRAILGNPFRIELAAQKHPATFVAFDILWLEGADLTGKPLMERKELLQQTVLENERLAVSRLIEQQGVKLFELAKAERLEGIVAKQKSSLYYPGKRTKEWQKIKNLQDDDFVICGYIYKEQYVVSLVLGQYAAGDLRYKGHVTLGVNGQIFAQVEGLPRRLTPPIAQLPPGNDQAVWLEPLLVCTVSYLESSSGGLMRHPLFKGLRPDKLPQECLVRESEPGE